MTQWLTAAAAFLLNHYHAQAFFLSRQRAKSRLSIPCSLKREQRTWQQSMDMRVRYLKCEADYRDKVKEELNDAFALLIITLINLQVVVIPDCILSTHSYKRSTKLPRIILINDY